MEYIKNIKCPMLMLCAELDDVIPYSHSKELFDMVTANIKHMSSYISATHIDFPSFSMSFDVLYFIKIVKQNTITHRYELDIANYKFKETDRSCSKDRSCL